MFGYKSKVSRSSVSPVTVPYEGSREYYRERQARMQAECRADDAEAKARALAYVPPVKLLHGASGRFIEVGCHTGRSVVLPLAFIVGVKLHPKENQGWRDASARLRLSIGMSSGFEQSIWVEQACADMLLDAIHKATGGGQ